MKSPATHADLIAKLEELRQLCPQFRLGQILSAIESIGEATTGRSLYHIDDADFIAAVEKFATDLAQCPQEAPASAE